jgi:hypothetical protein
MAIYKSAKGKTIDMGRLVSQNELAVAVSNVQINARGDILGPGGQIIRKQSDIPHVPSTGIPVERHIVTEPVVEQRVQPALIKPAPIVDTLIDPIVKESEKPSNYKGKQ